MTTRKKKEERAPRGERACPVCLAYHSPEHKRRHQRGAMYRLAHEIGVTEEALREFVRRESTASIFDRTLKEETNAGVRPQRALEHALAAEGDGRCDAVRGMESWQPRCHLRADHAGAHSWVPVPTVIVMCGRCHRVPASEYEVVEGVRLCSGCAPLARAERDRGERRRP